MHHYKLYSCPRALKLNSSSYTKLAKIKYFRIRKLRIFLNWQSYLTNLMTMTHQRDSISTQKGLDIQFPKDLVTPTWRKMQQNF